jgi:hypothetical protein
VCWSPPSLAGVISQAAALVFTVSGLSSAVAYSALQLQTRVFNVETLACNSTVQVSLSSITVRVSAVEATLNSLIAMVNAQAASFLRYKQKQQHAMGALSSRMTASEATGTALSSAVVLLSNQIASLNSSLLSQSSTVF